MILAFHSIFSFYGFWLPNDPRGSGSDYVASWELFRYGTATKVNSRHSVAAQPHDHQRRTAAKQALKFPPVTITGVQAIAVAQGFKKASAKSSYSIYACAILPDHVHLVIGCHRRHIRKIVGHLKAEGTRSVKERGQWHDDDRPLWGDHGWNVFLSDPAAVQRAIRYVEANPAKEELRPQRWSFVVPASGPVRQMQGR